MPARALVSASSTSSSQVRKVVDACDALRLDETLCPPRSTPPPPPPPPILLAGYCLDSTTGACTVVKTWDPINAEFTCPGGWVGGGWGGEGRAGAFVSLPLRAISGMWWHATENTQLALILCALQATTRASPPTCRPQAWPTPSTLPSPTAVRVHACACARLESCAGEEAVPAARLAVLYQLLCCAAAVVLLQATTCKTLLAWACRAPRTTRRSTPARCRRWMACAARAPRPTPRAATISSLLCRYAKMVSPLH